MASVDPIAHLECGIRKTRKVSIITGVILTVIGAIPLIYTLVNGAGHGKTSDLAAGLGIAGFFLLIGVILLIVGARTRPERDPVFVTLRDRPDDVVWIYEKDISRNGAVSHAVTLCTRAGATQMLNVKNQEAQVAMRNALRACCPNAVVGYSTERDIAFKRSPRDFA